MIKHKKIKIKTFLERLGAILVIVLTIVALLYIRKINIKNRIVTNYDQSWHAYEDLVLFLFEMYTF